MVRIAEETDQVAITARWQIDAPRELVYAIASDFEALPRHFPGLDIPPQSYLTPAII